MFGIGEIEEGKIYIYYGKMGSGKTTNAMLQVMKFYKRGSPVWINFPLIDLPDRKGEEGKDKMVWYEDDPSGILSMRHGLFVIDEAYMTLNSREWQNLPKSVFTAFTHVRKLDMTVIIIAQSWMRIDKSIREVASYAREFKGSSLFGKMYSYVDYEIDEMGDIIKKPPMEYETAIKGFSIVKKEVYNSFDTDYMFGSAPPHKEWPQALNYKPKGTTPPEAAIDATRSAMRAAPSAPGPSLKHGASSFQDSPRPTPVVARSGRG